MRRPRRLLLAAVAVLLLAAFLAAIRPRRALAELSAADPRAVALALAASLLSLVCWAEAQRRLHAAAGARVAPVRFLPAYAAAVFAKLVVPGGRAGGPAVVAYVVGRETDLAYEQDLAAASVGQLLGLFAAAVPALAGVGLLAAARPAGAVPGAGALVTAVVATTAAVAAPLWVVYARPGWARRAVHAATRPLRATVGRASARLRDALAPATVDRTLDRTAGTLTAIGTDRRDLPAAFALTVAGWLFAAGVLYASLLALGYPLQPALALFVVPAVSLANVVPLPAGIGTVEFALAGLLAALAPLTLPQVGAAVVLYRVCSDGFLALAGAVAGAVGPSYPLPEG